MKKATPMSAPLCNGEQSEKNHSLKEAVDFEGASEKTLCPKREELWSGCISHSVARCVF